MNLLSLYSGVGGIDLAAHWAGMNTVALCESDAWCRRVLARHWPDVPCFESDENVTRESIHERIDIIAGGPPCQPFSVAGKRGGVADPRHRWPQMARIVSELRPTWTCVENVAGFGDVAERLVRPDLEGLGYETIRVDIPAAAVGAPHERNRIFVVGYATSARLGRSEVAGTDRSDAGEIGSGSAESLRGRAGMADADRTIRNESESVAECSGSSVAGIARQRMADSDSAELGACEIKERLSRERTDGCGSTLADSDSLRQSQPQGLEHEQRRRTSDGSAHRHRSTFSGLGRDSYVVSDRLDSARWPAARGQEQHEWEPPRVTTERENRRRRLKALGNAVVPMQIYPILAAIYEWSHQ